MKRVFVVLSLLVALALLGVFVAVSIEDLPPSAPVAEPPPAPPPPPREVLAAEPPAEPPVSETPRAVVPQTPPEPIARGRLLVAADWSRDVTVDVPEPSAKARIDKSGGKDSACTFTVLWPTGAEIARKTAARGERADFSRLPHGVPLVLRVASRGFLTGLCCDVVLPPDGPLLKDVRLVAAPVCGFKVVQMPQRKDLSDCTVEIRDGSARVASARTDKRDVAWMTIPSVGGFRAVVCDSHGRQLADVPVGVWPSADATVRPIYVAGPNTLVVAVLDAARRRADGVVVRLTTDFENPRAVTTDKGGRAVFEGLTEGRIYEATARSSDGSIARSQFAATGESEQQVALALGKAGAFAGDVVDEGNAAIADATVEVTTRAYDSPFKATSDASGAFSIPFLPAGPVKVLVRREGFLDGRPDEPVLVLPGNDVKLRVRLHRVPAGAVVVIVRDDAGAPLDGATVRLLPSRRTATTASDGTCRFDGLPANEEQFAFAKKRGFRARAEAAAPPVVTVLKDTAVAAEVVLRASGAVPARGEVSLTGVVLDPSNEPVVGTRVECGASFGFVTTDGSFRLDGLAAPASGEPAELRILPNPGMLQPFRTFVDLDAAPAVDFGAVRLRARPYARIVAPRLSPAQGGSAAAVFWLSCNHPQTLLGAAGGRFEPVACVSYDGTWLHLPPADDWRLDGRGEVFVAQPTAHGLRTATSSWTLTPDAAITLSPSFVGEPQRVVVSVDNPDRDAVFLTQTACATLFDPRSVHVPTGNPQPPVDPFASLVADRCFDLGTSGTVTVDDVAPGSWIALFRSGRSAPAEFVVPGAATVILRR